MYTATEFPVETGASISDHMRAQPKLVSAEVFVSNTPTRPTIQLLTLTLRGAVTPKTLTMPAPFNPGRLFTGLNIGSPGAGTRTLLATLEGRIFPSVK